MSLGKAQVLPILEYSTATLYHANATSLRLIDGVQERFLREIGLSAEESLEEYALAPLRSRRDISMLGLVHKSALGLNAPQFNAFFKRTTVRTVARTRRTATAHARQLTDTLGTLRLEVTRRSALGLVPIYNLLPSSVTGCDNVRDFQKGLQQILKREAKKRNLDWPDVFSPRVPVYARTVLTEL